MRKNSAKIVLFYVFPKIFSLFCKIFKKNAGVVMCPPKWCECAIRCVLFGVPDFAVPTFGVYSAPNP